MYHPAVNYCHPLFTGNSFNTDFLTTVNKLKKVLKVKQRNMQYSTQQTFPRTFKIQISCLQQQIK